MARRYAIEGTQALASPADTVLGLTGGTTIKPGIYHLICGLDPSEAAQDTQLALTVQRYTAAGTSTSVTPSALDTGSPAASSTAGENHTAEPTYTAGAELLVYPFNSRDKAVWYAMSDDAAMYATAAASNGLGVFLTHSTATAVHACTVHFLE